MTKAPRKGAVTVSCRRPFQSLTVLEKKLNSLCSVQFNRRTVGSTGCVPRLAPDVHQVQQLWDILPHRTKLRPAHSPAHQSSQHQRNQRNLQSQSLAAGHPPAHCCLCPQRALSSGKFHPAHSLHTSPSLACRYILNFIIIGDAGNL